MQKGKSQYIFSFRTHPENINNTIQNFLKAHGFKMKQDNGTTYFHQYDFMWGNRFFEYYIQGNQVMILAYIGKFKKPCMLDDSFVGIAAKSEYKNILQVLFNTINQM